MTESPTPEAEPTDAEVRRLYRTLESLRGLWAQTEKLDAALVDPEAAPRGRLRARRWRREATRRRDALLERIGYSAAEYILALELALRDRPRPPFIVGAISVKPTIIPPSAQLQLARTSAGEVVWAAPAEQERIREILRRGEKPILWGSVDLIDIALALGKRGAVVAGVQLIDWTFEEQQPGPLNALVRRALLEDNSRLVDDLLTGWDRLIGGIAFTDDIGRFEIRQNGCVFLVDDGMDPAAVVARVLAATPEPRG